MSDSTWRLTDSTFRTTSRSTNGKQLEYVRKAAGEISHYLFYHGLWVVLKNIPSWLTDSRAADFGKEDAANISHANSTPSRKEIVDLIMDRTRSLVKTATLAFKISWFQHVWRRYRALP